MEKIIAPVTRNSNADAVKNLQGALILLLATQRIDQSDPDRQTAVERLSREISDGIYGEVTTQVVTRFQRARGLASAQEGQVDEPTAAILNRQLEELGAFAPPPAPHFQISGRIEFEDGTPGSTLIVAAYDREIGKPHVRLGDSRRTITDDEGVFPAIRYLPQVVESGEGRRGPSADLVFEIKAKSAARPLEIVRIFRNWSVNAPASETLVADGPVLGFEADPVESVRVVLAGRPREDGLPEYERLMRELEPLLIDGSTPADFDQERYRDIDFSARETGWDPERIGTMVAAWQLARAAMSEPQRLAETFYGLLRAGSPTEVAPLAPNPDELLEQNARWARKLEDSLAHEIIGGKLETHLDHLRELRIDAAMRPGSERKATVGDVLASAGVAKKQRRELLDLYEAHAGPIEEFWQRVVPQRLGWNSEQIRDVQATLQFADILGNDLLLVKRLRRRGFKTTRDLIRLDRADWIDIVSQVPLPDVSEDKRDEQIARQVDGILGPLEAIFPTEVIARVAATSPDPMLSAARDLVTQFFERESAAEGDRGFDIRTSPVTTYLEAHAERVFQDIDDEQRVLLTSQLQRLQRVFRLGVDRSQTEALLELGLDSAAHITRFSPEHFLAEFGERLGGKERASITYSRAESTAGTLLYSFTDLWQGIHDVKPLALRTREDAEKIPALKELPTYRSLFGSQRLCGCEHCRSFYSPAAYFVDLLHMLDRPSLGANNPVEVLFRRRPDLAHIQLTCENTNTRIPYIDLVTEVLESFVANRTSLAFNVPPLPPNHVLPSPSAEELRVNPVHLTADSSTFADKAYTALQNAVFPLNLPLNLPLETTRAYLEHLGTSRAELMALLDRDTGLPSLMALAAEILGLSPEEFEIISASKFSGASALRPATAAEFFGLSIADTATENPRTLFNHAAPEFAHNPASPDERSALIRSLQNVLSFISAAPVPATGTELGTYDAATESAVNAYLQKKGLPQNGRTDDAFWGALESDGMPSVSVLLCPVPMFLEHSGLTYEELIALVKTRFVNPLLQGDGDLDYLARLGIPSADVRAWLQNGLPAIPAAMLAKLTAANEDPDLFTSWVKDRAQAVVLNTAFESPCDLDRTTIMHLDSTLLMPNELVRLFRFIRLWRKLGWTLDEIDLALESGSLDSAATFSTVLLLANLKQLRERLDAPIADLVCLWGSIPVHGGHPLYDHLFRNRAAQWLDPIFELNRERSELKAVASASPPALSDYAAPILAAFRLSAEDLTLIREATGLADNPALPPANQPRLTLTSLSAIYRKVMLARALGISIREMLSLLELTGSTVFERPQSFPRGAALGFVNIVDRVRASRVKIGDLEYLCRDVPQPPRLPGPQRNIWYRTLASLIDGLLAITAEDSPTDDPTGELLTARLTTLLGPADARDVTDLIHGRTTYAAQLVGFPVNFSFPSAIRNRITYDASGKQLKLRGAMTSGDYSVLWGVADVPAGIRTAYENAVDALKATPRAFLARALKSMFTTADAEGKLIDKPTLDVDGKPDATVIQAKIDELLERRRKILRHSLIKQTLSTATGLPADIIELLLTNDDVLTAINSTGPAMEDFQAIEGDGLAASYFASPDPTGTPVAQRIDPAVVFDWLGMPPAPGVPAVGFSVRWAGSIYIPTAGEVTFKVQCRDGVRIRLNGELAFDEWRDQPKTQFDRTLRLDGGQFYPIEVEYYSKTGGAALELGWSSPSFPSSSIPQAALYTPKQMDEFLMRIKRIYKLALLLIPFNLTVRDLVGLAARKDLSLDMLPIEGPAPTATAQAMFLQWLALHDFSVLRDRYPASEVALIDVLSAPPARATAIERFTTLSGTSAATLEAILDALTVPIFDPVTSLWKIDTPDLARVAVWQRIAETLDLVRRTGASPVQLLSWAKARQIKQLPTGPENLWFSWTALDEDGQDRGDQNRRLAQEAKDLVRAKYDEKRWLAVAQTLNDRLRDRRRSALVGFLLAMPELMQAHVTSSECLFEFFLIDPEMGPCMETSRIKQGCSSVQLFTQRVLLNLEAPLVPPTRVDRGRWEWMKTYRVWEANRKVWCYPESYTEEELRDNKTPFFKEFESQLLQDDLTDANAERAFRHYLEKLDGVAKLIVCGTCIDSDGFTLHVFGRTATMPFAYYHRRLDSSRGQAWTEGLWSPWEKLPVDVATVEDGDSSGVTLLPIVWNRRLYLFWLVFEQKPDESENILLPNGFDPINCWHIKLAWSEYKDGRWSPKQVGVPFVVSKSFVNRTTSRSEDKKVFQKKIKVYQGHTEIGFNNVPVQYPEIVIEENYGEIKESSDPMLAGTVLFNKEDWASHHQVVDIVKVLSLMPKPESHFLDASIVDGQLSLRVLCRFKGTPKGQGRKVTTDTIAVVKEGRRTDRQEQSQEDFHDSDVEVRLFGQVGTFIFPACSAHLSGVDDVQVYAYELLQRPQDTINSFMALREDSPLGGGLRLVNGRSPVLKAVPDRYEVIDSDNRMGFDRSVPFFYQDQRRCFLVTRDWSFRLFEPEKQPRLDSRAGNLQRVVGLITLGKSEAATADSPLRSNPWVQSALYRWSKSPNLPATRPSNSVVSADTLSAAIASLNLSGPGEATAIWDDLYADMRSKYTFAPHWHPHTCSFMSALNSGGLPALFSLTTQSLNDATFVLSEC